MAAALGSCSERSSSEALKKGDLLFQVNEPTEFTEAITKATADSEGNDFSHVGIFACIDGDSVVIEATSTKGVVTTPLDEFVASANGKIVAMRVAETIDIDACIASAMSHLGEPYDWTFREDNGKMYCSELVETSYRYADGTPVFEKISMNFKDANGEMPEFWIRLFDEMGETIPQGALGTNPNSIFVSKSLRRVNHKF